MDGEGEHSEEIETAAAQVGETVAAVAAEIIEDHAAQIEVAAEVNEALVSANLERIEETRRQEFMAEVRAEIERFGGITLANSESLASCLTQIQELTEALALLTVAQVATTATLETASSIPTPSNPPSVAEGLPDQTQNPASAKEAPEPNQNALFKAKRKTHLL